MTDQITAIAQQTMQYPFKVWGFGEGIALEAVWEAAEVTGEVAYRRFVLDLFGRWLARPIEEPDHSAPGALLLTAYETTQDRRYLQRALELAQHMRELPRHANGAAFHRPQHPDYHPYIYVDCMEVDAPFLCKLAAVTGENRWYDAAVEQIMGYAALLQDDASGLFYHQYDGESGATNGAFWGRGNGWALLGLTKTLAQLPADHPSYVSLMDRYQRLCTTLAACQATNGSWHTVLNRPDTYQEHSLAPMFGYGLLKGIERGWLNATLQSVVDRAWDALLTTLDGGLLRGVSVATPPGDADHYNHIPTGAGFPWGQGPALLLAMARHS